MPKCASDYEIRVLVNSFLAGNYLFKVYKRNTRTRCEIRSTLTIKTPERRQWRHSDVFIVNFEHISYLVLVFLLLTLNILLLTGFDHGTLTRVRIIVWWFDLFRKYLWDLRNSSHFIFFWAILLLNYLKLF